MISFKSEQGFDAKMLMEPDKVVAAAIKGLQNNKFDIYPGAATAIKWISRIAPSILLNQFSKMADKALAKDKF